MSWQLLTFTSLYRNQLHVQMVTPKCGPDPKTHLLFSHAVPGMQSCNYPPAHTAQFLLSSSQDRGLIRLIEFIPWDARLLRSQAEESGRRDRAEHRQCCYYSTDACQEDLAVNIFCATGRDGMRCSPQKQQNTSSLSCSPAVPHFSLHPLASGIGWQGKAHFSQSGKMGTIPG